MAVATCAHRVGQQHAVKPAVNNAVTGPQGNAAACAHKVWQLVVHFHVNWLGVSGCVAKRLHDKIRAKAEAGQVFQFVAGHGAGGVL